MPMVSMQLRRVSAKHGGSYTKQRYSRQVLITNLQPDIIYIIGNQYQSRYGQRARDGVAVFPEESLPWPARRRAQAPSLNLVVLRADYQQARCHTTGSSARRYGPPYLSPSSGVKP